MRILGKELETADIAFAIFLIVSLAWNFGFISQLKQIPSPIYGGDLYNGLGGVNHIMEGGSFLESAQMAGEHPWVPWLYHLSVALFSGLSGLDAMQGLLYFSLVIQLFSLAIVYALGTKILGDKWAALVAAVLFSSQFPVFKYGDLATAVFVPGMLLALYLFSKKQDDFSAVVAGAAMGLASLTNTQAFFVANLILGFAAVWWLYPKVREGGLNARVLKENSGLICRLALIFAVGFIVAMPFWFGPIFEFRGQTPNDIQNITYPDVTQPQVFAGITYNLVVSLLLPFGLNGIGIAFSLLNLAGLYFMARNPGKYAFAVILVATFLASVLHPILTVPLIHAQFMSSLMLERISLLTAVILVGIGVINAMERVKGSNAKAGIAAVCILLALFYVAQGLEARGSDRWTLVGREPLPGPYAELEGWIKGNTDVNDVFLTTNEDGFMMNALTGRKVVSYRRAHSSPYTDMHARMADQAVMVYGNNAQETSELLGKYDVKYLLVTYNWIRNEFQISPEGQLVGFFDPLSVPDNYTNKAYWDANGVRYLEVTMSMDPAPRDNVPLYDMLVALPYPMQEGGPISPQLMEHFGLVKTIYSEGYAIFQVYERVD
ncbi:MAG: hypothetical protein AB1657_04920 [Candidatus Micrarchaeota archaeon]